MPTVIVTNEWGATGVAASSLGSQCGTILRQKEISRGRAIANEFYFNQVERPPLEDYTPNNRITVLWNNNLNNAGDLISRTLCIRYEGPLNIGDRNIIEETVFNPRNHYIEKQEVIT